MSLGARSTATVSFDYTVSGPGNKRMVVVADPRDEIPEDDRGNNESSRPRGLGEHRRPRGPARRGDDLGQRPDGGRDAR
jgi:hypothetical protein